MDSERILNEEMNDIVSKSIISNLLKETEESEGSIPDLKEMVGSSYKNIENGVTIQFGDKFWGIVYEDGNSRSYGWVELKSAIIYNPEFLKRPEDATYENSPYISELKKGTLVKVGKTTIVDFELKY